MNEIPPDLKDAMNGVADVLENVIKESTGRKMGFALMVSDFGPDGTMSFISNTKRESLVPLLKELVENLEKEGAEDDKKTN